MTKKHNDEGDGYENGNFKFVVFVEKKLTVSGSMIVYADDEFAAEKKVHDMITSGKLQSSEDQINWDDPDYVDLSFTTTGDVDDAE